jgi:hypothetical protein
MTDFQSDGGALARALDRLDAALTTAKVSHFFQPADELELEDVFAELRSHGLEPSKRLTDLYAHANPADVTLDPWLYGSLELVPARFLAESHEGVALNSNGRLRAGWRGHWIIIAKAGGDPYVVNASKPDLPVFTDTHGVGAWQPKLVASSLVNFIETCASWVDHFVRAGLDPEPESYRESGDESGERASRAAWKAFLTDLRERDPEAADDAFWPNRG